MTNTNQGGGNDPVSAEMNMAWEAFEIALCGYLATMTDPDEGDHLLLEVTDPEPDIASCPPYAQFAACGGGAMIRAEISGDAHLRPQFRLGVDAVDWFAREGWGGGAAAGTDDQTELNWCTTEPLEEAAAIARVVVSALRDRFGIVHPQLLTYQAWGPAAEGVGDLGLFGSDALPHETPHAGTEARLDELALMPCSRAELVDLVKGLLRVKYADTGITVDEDGDAVLSHLGQPVWVCVRRDQPAVEILARVAHDVHSRRGTAVELGILNRDNVWVRWTLRERAVWQILRLPAHPFVPTQLDEMLDVYLAAMSETRDDLALRTGAKVA